MATDPSICHPGEGIEALNRLPGLAEPLLQIDMERELQQLRQEESWQREAGRSSKTLAKYPDLRIVLILMKGGSRMRQHRAEGRVSIQLLEGRICIHLADRKVNMSAGHLLVLDCGVLHDVETLEESALLLTICWRREKSDAPDSFSSTQQHLDEEAVSRMDDEGGAPDVAMNPPGAVRKAGSDGQGSGGCNRFMDFIDEVAMATDAVLVAGLTSRLMRREEVAEGTMAFHFEKPSGFNFKAGQSADVTLTNPPDTDAEGNTRTFSIASPPFENELVFTTRMRDTAFKRSLKKVPLNTEVKLGSAAGSFTLHKNPSKPAVFLAGGTGITPFLSIVRQADHNRLAHKLYLFYSNRRPEEAAFLNTLQTLEKTNPNFRLVCTMTEVSKCKEEQKGETTLIDKQMLSRHLGVLQGPIYYIAGPPTMVAAMRETLVSAGVEGDDIRAEEFAGY